MFLDIPLGGLRKRETIKELPPVPVTGWKPPAILPDLSSATLIAYDVETKENDWEHGPGWARGKGHIVGFSVAAIGRNNERWKGYLPIRHETAIGENLNPQGCIAWLKQTLENSIPKTGANLIYDTGWLQEEGINVGGPLYDTQFAEALLDEQAPTALQWLGMKYLGVGKSSAGLYEWCAKAFGGKPTPKQRANIYRAPPSLVGFYAESDADLPLDILPIQWAELYAQNLIPLFEMECRLIRLLIKMRRTGVAIDLDYTERLYREMQTELRQLHAAFNRKYGRTVNYNSGVQITPVLDDLGIGYPRTEMGAPSVTKEWLEALKDKHEVGAEIIRLRELDKLTNTFLRSYLLEGHTNGRIHCQFHPLRGDKDGGSTKGAKTGRFSSSDPNLQNIPSRTEDGARIRRAFVHDYGHKDAWKNDYSQIEYRMLAHFAVGPGADELRQSYIDDPDTDYHERVYLSACPYLGWDPNESDKALVKRRRKPIKNTNFGLLYGQGRLKLARTMNLDKKGTDDFFDAYHTAAPYVKPTMAEITKEVHQYGYVTTILGRRTRFNVWVPFDSRGGEDDEQARALPYEEALRKYGSNIERAWAYRGVNYKLQGSAADMMKRAMDLCESGGVFDTIGVPKLTVHDELFGSRIDDSPRQVEAYRELQHIMETAIPLRIPVRADPEYGPNWGECE